MFSIREPSEGQIRAFLGAQRPLPFSYPYVGMTREARPPAGFDLDHHRVRLGAGRADFERACAAVRRWTMFDLGWVRLCWPDAPIAEGTVVAMLARGPGLWSLNACRIAYTVDEVGPVARFGFAYGTLPGHLERGEERFAVEWHREDDSVWYDLLAVSRLRHVLARAAYPYVRRLQRRFAVESMRAMGHATGRIS